MNNFNLILSLLIFLTVVISFRISLWYALGTGLLLEMFSAYPYGLIIISLFLTVVLIDWLLNHFLTNRSYYSLLLLGLIGLIFYYLLLFGFGYLLNLLKISIIDEEFSRHYFNNLFWQAIINSVGLTLAWRVTGFFGRKFKIISLIEK